MKNKNKNNNEDSWKYIENNSKIFQILKDQVCWMAKLEAEEEFYDKKFKRTKKYLFYRGLFNLVSELNNKIHDLVITKEIIFNYKKVENKKFSKEDYITYHREFFFINIISIFDRVLHFINFIYKLGLHDSFVKKELIVKNTRIDAEMIKFIKRFDKSINGIRKLQNRIKHKSKFKDDGFHKFGKYMLYYDNIEDKKLKKQMLGFHVSEYKKYKEDLNKNLKKNILAVMDLVDEFFVKIEPEVLKTDNKFKK